MLTKIEDLWVFYLVSLHTIWYLFNFIIIIIVVFSLFAGIKLAGILMREAIGLIVSLRTVHYMCFQ